jgi:3-deoxy-D-manno-octulosonate 8-phosphate phosphatase (KDO 8-P phosphatase)
MKNLIPDFNNIKILVFDFDGVLTNNIVHLDQHGNEWVSCSRSDGLAFDVLHKLKKRVYILSTESNPVVAARAKKLRVPVIQGVSNKVEELNALVKSENCHLNQVLYVGNDLNDYNAMKCCGYTACPSDSHPKIQSIVDVVLRTSGGNGVVRELLEDVFKLDFIKILYLK